EAHHPQTGVMLTTWRLSSPLTAKLTCPSTVANSVWSRPTPTFEPAWNLVPRWRTMMEPADTNSPPNAFTPSILGLESRPFRVEPPPFFCAISNYSSGRDRSDLQLGEILTMTLALLVVLATAHLEDADLVATTVRQHGGQDLRAGYQGRAHL